MKCHCIATASLALTVAASLLLVLLFGACAAPPPALVAQDVTFVVTLDGEPVPGAAIYAGGQPLPNALVTGSLTTNLDGRLATSLANADSVVALAPAALFTTTRPAHDWLAAPLRTFAGPGQQSNWRYQVFWNSLDWDETGAPIATPVSASGTYTLALSRQRPLILFNLLVSVEWDADQTYLDDLELAMRRASSYLWDVTDGQMALGQVRIVDSSKHWQDADIQVLASNNKIPHASIGGIEEDLEPEKYRIQLGPYWDRQRKVDPGSPWSEVDGFRTIVHELGHYALGLYDEYVGSDKKGHYCISHQPTQTLDSTGASVMNYQYTTSELSSDDVPALWSEECKHTLQWQRTTASGLGQSAWDTVVHRFSRLGEWQVVPPFEQARSGPIATTWLDSLMAVPAVKVQNCGSDAGRVTPFAVMIPASAGSTLASSLWLDSPALGCALNLGQITAAQPHLWVLGGHTGDTLYARQQVDVSTWLCASQTISDTTAPTVTLALERHDFSCQPDLKVCNSLPLSGLAEAAQPVLLAPFDAPRQQLPSDVVWAASPPLNLAMIPFNQEPAAAAELGFDAALEELFTISAVQNLFDRSTRGEPPVGNAQVCFPAMPGCQPLDIGVTSNALAASQSADRAGRPALLTLASDDGLFQVFRQGSEIPGDLIIVDSPLPASLDASRGELAAVSRLYTLGGTWSNADLLVQIQADCCAGDDQRPPRLYRIENGTPAQIEESWYASQEGYVLATIREPGAYALFQ